MKTIFVIVLVLQVACTVVFGQYDNDDLLGRKVGDLTINADNSFTVLLEVFSRCEIPIGIEMSPNKVSGKDSAGQIVIEDGTVKDVLNAFVRFNSEYEWSQFESVINVHPRSSFDREPILDLKLTKFDVRNEPLDAISQGILAHPEVLSFLKGQGLVINNDITRFGVVVTETRSFSTQNVSVRELLNLLLKTNQAKYWKIFRGQGRMPWVKLVVG